MKYVTFHLHFYQPPRINPFVNEIEFQDNAYPYDNWNERILMESYLPNVYARIFDASGYIINIINNLEYVSFNFGPTLIGWIKDNNYELYQKIIEADMKSIKRLGYGNAIAQIYNHVIMPLANNFDKEIQVYWGLKDFKYHFGRSAKGMWLPETAVDLSTLEKLAEYGIYFTILAPHQIKRYRKIGSQEWVDNNGILPNKPFLVNLPSGKKIVVFAYNSKISHAVSFEDILSNGKELANNILYEFKDDNDIIVIAADGETYGHHKKFGELGLAYAITMLSSIPSVRVCNLEYYIKDVGVFYEAEINENTSWSCYHGIERWKDDCGCKYTPNTSQKWRKNLRILVDTIRNTFEQIYFDNITFLNVPDLRKEYIEYIIKRDNEIRKMEDLEKLICEFTNKYNFRDCENAKKVVSLLEIYKNIMFAYTSCGWFYDDISGLEATANLKFLYYAIKNIKEVCKIDLEPIIWTILKETHSNYYSDALKVFDYFIKPSFLESSKIAATYIFNKIFISDKSEKFLNYFWKIENFDKYSSNDNIISCGSIYAINISNFTELKKSYIFLYLGDLTFYFGLGEFDVHQVFSKLKNYLLNGNIVEMISLVDEYCQEKFSLSDIFVNTRRNILKKLIFSNVKNIDRKIDEIFSEQKTIIRKLVENNYFPIPLEMKLIILLILDSSIEEAIENFDPSNDYEDIFYFLSLKNRLGFNIDEEKFKLRFSSKLKNILIELETLLLSDSVNIEKVEKHIDKTIKFIDFSLRLMSYNLWEAQNVLFSLYNRFRNEKENMKKLYNQELIVIEEKLNLLADKLKIRMMI